MRAKTPSFILELPLTPSSTQTRHLRARFEAARNLYNALLAEALTRFRRLSRSPEWTSARTLPKNEKKKRNLAFAAARELYGFSEFALHHFSASARTGWLAEHIDSTTAQTLASRAFSAANKLAVAQARKVRFKSKARGLDTIEGKSNKTGLRFLLDQSLSDKSADLLPEPSSAEPSNVAATVEQTNRGYLIWRHLKIVAMIDWADPLVYYSLGQRIKYVRLCRRKASSAAAKGADCAGYRYYVQLVLEGKPYEKPQNKVGNLTIGLDLGPQTIAIVSENAEVARLEVFAHELKPQHKKKRCLQRKLDRQRRANNPENFDEKGRIKRGKKEWKDSGAYRETKRRLSNQERKLAATRKSAHGRLVNEIVAEGNTIKLEKLNYKSWQKQYGKSVGMRAPGMFEQRLKRTVEGTGGTFLLINTRKTKLSQVCHGCGAQKKKGLGERWHACECGVVAQRDLYSAYLAAHIDEQTNNLSIAQCRTNWEGVEQRLWGAVERVVQRAREGEEFPRSMGLGARARVRHPQSLRSNVGEAAGP